MTARINQAPKLTQTPTQALISVDCPDRWQAYHRLVELGLTCQCQAYQPLLVQVDSPIQLLQLRSVLKHLSAPRQELVLYLDRCFRRLPFSAH